MAARTQAELKTKASGSQGIMLKARHDALTQYVADAKQAVSNAPQTDGSKGPSYEQRQCQFLEDKLAANKVLLEVYEGKGGVEKEKAFFESATKSWEKGVPDVCARLEETIKGTFVLGDQVVSSHSHSCPLWQCGRLTTDRPVPRRLALDLLAQPDRRYRRRQARRRGCSFFVRLHRWKEGGTKA